MSTCLRLLCGLVSTQLVWTASAQTGGWTTTTSDAGILIAQDDQPVLFYQSATKSQQGRSPRAGYVHPLFGLHGQALTEDFPADHLHHRGVFWAWHQVWVGDQRMGDPWLCRDFQWDVVSTNIQHLQGSVELQANVLWKSPLYQDAANHPVPIVRETTTITAHDRTTNYRCIEFEISILALVDGVRIGGSDDAKGYGGFSPRISLNANQVFSADQGVVKPTLLAMDLGRWVDIRDQHWGLTIITHDQNPSGNGGDDQVGSESRTPWILRRKRSMQNAVYPGRDPVELSSDQATRLRYRLVVHDATISPAEIESLCESW